jgi:hypothetical protein
MGIGRNRQQCVVRTLSVLAWTERETIALCTTSNRRGCERRGGKSEVEVRYCCGHCEIVEKKQ